MNILGFDIAWRGWAGKQTLTLDQLIHRLEAAYETVSGVAVTPETAMQSPTVQAVIRAVGGYLSTLPPHVLLKTTKKGRDAKEPLPNHSVQRLLNHPNDYQDRVTYWLDAASRLVRYGNYYVFKGRGVTGPIRRLEPLHPSAVEPEQQDDLSVRYRVTRSRGEQRTYEASQIHHARLTARDSVKGDSPVMDVRESIALEIAAEKFGSAFFGNGAAPSVIFKYAQGFQGHKTTEERQQFIQDFQAAYTGRGRFRAMLLPKGVEMDRDVIALDNDKAQFLATRKYQRTVIAGAFGVPPQYVGDLERATFNNAEQQSIDFVQNVILPYVRIFEAAMERDLLTVEDRIDGVCIRFNVDAALRGDFKTRQEGLKIQREAGVISPNDWREFENMNPISAEDGGDDYWRQGPSGQQAGAGTPPRAVPAGANANGNGNGGR